MVQFSVGSIDIERDEQTIRRRVKGEGGEHQMKNRRMKVTKEFEIDFAADDDDSIERTSLDH